MYGKQHGITRINSFTLYYTPDNFVYLKHNLEARYTDVSSPVWPIVEGETIVWERMLTKFETQSHRVKGEGAIERRRVQASFESVFGIVDVMHSQL